MNYNQFFKQELDKLKDEGNYRVFADLEKIAGNFWSLSRPKFFLIWGN